MGPGPSPRKTPGPTLHFEAFVRIFLLLFLTGCTTSTPRLLADGAPLAPVEPRVTYTPTGAGLPEYWGTPEAPKVERSPHARVLPPTKEPGLWAGDEPKSMRTMDPPNILGVLIPYPPGLMREEDKVPTQRCAYASQKVITAAADMTQLAALTETERRCLATKLYRFCVDRDKRIIDKNSSEGRFYDRTVSKLMPYVVSEALRLERVGCGGVVVSDGVLGLYHAATESWQTHDEVKE